MPGKKSVAGGTVSGGGMVRRAPKTRRSAAAQRKMAPQMVENQKATLFMRGESSSEVVQKVLTDLYILKKPVATKFQKKNEFRPFETTQHLEFLSFKNDASLFGFGSHSKKRPHNLILGRHFDYQLLDMVEFGVKQYESMKAGLARIAPGSKPLLLFVGDCWDTLPALARVKNVLADFFRGRVVTNINLAGLDHCICMTLRPTDASQEISVSDDGQSVKNATVLFRHYALRLLQSGEKVPRVELTDAGPSLDLEVRRCQLATPERFSHACKVPKQEISLRRREKSGQVDKMGHKYGQVHVGSQTAELGKLGTRNFKAFKQRRRDAAAAAHEGDRQGTKRKAAMSVDEAGPAITKKRRRKSGPGAQAAMSAPDDVM
eukprot:TRINITY_DN39956_c0_g1_i1.p1 TRINITY_DN39956_c0_g1~~TRINITY_DN39956_c0_g1_i1.p1  ORF type:complete len:375 (+),score=119.72 TRINITY_DN39956_c0_g1_i1:65-1189(+)